MDNKLSKSKIGALVVLRILIGWHFLYEGVTKLYNPSWTSKAYLLNASGPFEEFFAWLSSDGLITTIDTLNIIGLTAIGLALILGFWDRLACVGGMVLLLFYYLSQPPFPGVDQVGTEGNYFLVNKNLIEAAALWILYYLPTGHYVGVSRLIAKSESKHQTLVN